MPAEDTRESAWDPGEYAGKNAGMAA